MQPKVPVIVHIGYGHDELNVVVDPSVQFTPPNIQFPPEKVTELLVLS